ncbi:hypothetical protein ACFX5K_00725 [Rickettsiales bacterium LUAb2]
MNRISLLLLILLILISSSVFAATNKYYEIDFTYQNIINKKSYTEEAVLLRDKAWLEENNIHKAGDTLILNIPEFGVINAKATAKEVKSTTLNPIKAYTNNQSMVTGTFKHYSNDVREYTLKNTKTGSIQNIQATPNHAFYVSNRTAFNKALNQDSHFIEIQDITPNDKLINEAGNVVQLVCDNNVCGTQLVTNNKPIAVYNLEIFKQHQYLVISNKANNSSVKLNNAVLVHNIYDQVQALKDSGIVDDRLINNINNDHHNGACALLADCLAMRASGHTNEQITWYANYWQKYFKDLREQPKKWWDFRSKNTGTSNENLENLKKGSPFEFLSVSKAQFTTDVNISKNITRDTLTNTTQSLLENANFSEGENFTIGYYIDNSGTMSGHAFSIARINNSYYISDMPSKSFLSLKKVINFMYVNPSVYIEDMSSPYYLSKAWIYGKP